MKERIIEASADLVFPDDDRWISVWNITSQCNALTYDTNHCPLGFLRPTTRACFEPHTTDNYINITKS